MTEGDDLLGKADALLGRYRASAPPDFPVLTEVVPQPSADLSSGGQPNRKVPSLHGPADASATGLKALEDRLVEQVLSAIEPCITDLTGPPFREQISSRLASALSSVCDEIANDIQAELRNLVRNAVSSAIQQELPSIRARTEKS